MASYNRKALLRRAGNARQRGEGEQYSDLASHSTRAEEAVLGSILISPQVLHEVLPILEAHHFFLPHHQYIYEAIESVEARHEAVNEQTVAAELERRNLLDDVGSQLTEIISSPQAPIRAASEARIIKECWRRRQALDLVNRLATAPLDGAGRAEGQRIRDALTQLMADESEDEGLRQHLLAANALAHLDDPTWLIESLLPAQGLTVLYGPSGSGKSFLGLHLASLVAQEHAVLYVAAEGEAGFKHRVAAWQKYHNQDAGDLHFFFDVVPLLDPRAERRFCVEIVEHIKPTLIILDTVAHCMLPGDENSTRDMMQFVRAAKRIQKKYGPAVMLIHHSNKEGIVERGSGSLRAAADSMIRLSLEDELICVECAKSKDVAPFPTQWMKLLPVEVAKGKLTPVIVPAEKITRTANDAPSVKQRQVMETILDVFDDFGAPWTELADQLRVISHGTLRRILADLRKVGFVSQEEVRAPYKVTEAGAKAIGRGGSDHDQRATDHGSVITDLLSPADD